MQARRTSARAAAAAAAKAADSARTGQRTASAAAAPATGAGGGGGGGSGAGNGAGAGAGGGAAAAAAAPKLFLFDPSKRPKQPYPYSRRDPYPRHVRVDFRRLDPKTLRLYADEHGLDAGADMGEAELAVTVARHFDATATPASDEDLLTDFMYHIRTAGSYGYGRDMGRRRDGGETQGKKKRRRRAGVAPSPIPLGTRVCALVGENWIMARVSHWSPRSRQFQVDDEDAEADDSEGGGVARHTVPFENVLTLSEDGSTAFRRRDRVLALFPQTTSFYAGFVVSPFRNGMIGVAFDDDEEDGMIVSERAVPAAFVLRYPDAR